jgi:hypothetical protein
MVGHVIDVSTKAYAGTGMASTFIICPRRPGPVVGGRVAGAYRREATANDSNSPKANRREGYVATVKTLHCHRAGFEPQRASSFMKRVKASEELEEAARA